MAAATQLHAPKVSSPKDLYEIGEVPPLGHVPAKMHAWAIRKERHGPPETSFQLEVVPTWPIGEDEVLVYVMAAGVNYNGVWAGLGVPISPLDGHKNPFHIAGSDAAGIVWAVGSKVRRWKVGDEVIVHCNQDDGDDEDCNGGDPLLSPSQRIWGYETPDGSFAQFCRVQSRQLMPKPAHLTWEEAACNALCNSTSYRMIVSPNGAQITQGQSVLVWGATGGIGAYAVQYVLNGGGTPVGVVSSPERAALLNEMGCEAVIDRRAEGYRFWSDEHTQDPKEWQRLGKRIRELVGEDPDIVFEHPGRQTMGASIFACKRGGSTRAARGPCAKK